MYQYFPSISINYIALLKQKKQPIAINIIHVVILQEIDVLGSSKPDGFERYLWLISLSYDLKDNMVSLGYLNERLITSIFIVTGVCSLEIGVSRFYWP